MTYTLETIHRIYNDTTGDYIEVGPDADTGELLELRQHEQGKVVARIVGTHEQLAFVAQAILSHHSVPLVAPQLRKIRLNKKVQSQHHPEVVHEVGAEGIIVEALDADTSLVEIRIPDESLEGDAWYDTLDLPNAHFELVPDENCEKSS